MSCLSEILSRVSEILSRVSEILSRLSEILRELKMLITPLFLSFERREKKSMLKPHIPHLNLQKRFEVDFTFN